MVKSRGHGWGQILHDRARNAADEFQRLVVSFSAAGVAVYFFALTDSKHPVASYGESFICFNGMFLFAFAICCGLVSLRSDTKRYYYLAKSIQTRNESNREVYERKHSRWNLVHRISETFLVMFFLLGVASSVFFVMHSNRQF